jgi:DNA-binding MurR/RpiR family transcriptional regulator
MTEEDSTLDRSLVSPGDRLQARFRKNTSAEIIQRRVIESETRSLVQTLEDLEASGEVPRAAALILGARRRFIQGVGKSAAYAQLLTTDLSATLSNVFLIDGRSLNELAVLSDVRPTDVLVVFSMRRYRTESHKLAKLFQESGGEVIVVTDSAEAPLAQFATCLIRVQTGSASYADSPTAAAAVCHLLSTLTTASAKGARRRLQVRDQISRDLDIYLPESSVPETSVPATSEPGTGTSDQERAE